jgi:dihydroorotase
VYFVLNSEVSSEPTKKPLADMPTLLITNALIINEGKQFNGSVLIENKIIKSIINEGDLLPVASKTINAAGKYLIPGVIDDQVHFREPGLTHKGEIYSESRAAIAGGVTSFMDMPNTIPQTINHEHLQAKFQRASEASMANYSFYLGATNDNLDEIIKSNPAEICGVKVFMGSSTGNMLVDKPETLKNLFSESPLLIAVHCEDEKLIRANIETARTRFGEDVPIYLHPIIRNEEACFRSSQLAVDLAHKYNTRLHILHMSTARELELLQGSENRLSKRITAEVCVHHLIFNESDYFTRGTLIKWNPAIKSDYNRESLLNALIMGRIDIVATDHAPHTMAEKQNTYFKAPSGGPLVQHSLVAMLEFCYKGVMQPWQVVDKMCHGPADLFKIDRRGYIREGYYADLAIVDPESPWTVSVESLLYKCGWSPFTGFTFHSKITQTFVNGNLVYDDGKINDNFRGEKLKFLR